MQLRRWAGFTQAHPLVMGILNVTPDSFSDGGRNHDPVAAAFAMMQDGADLIDVGGESTRPGAPAVSVDVEIARVVPVIGKLAAAGVVVSVDTRNADTMRAALAAGARIINDVSALAHDPDSAAVVAQAGCQVVLMHMRGTPESMTKLSRYDDVAVDVLHELQARVAFAEASGIDRAHIAIDPGVGFAKGADANIALLQRLELLMTLDLPMLVGLSRKGFIGSLSGETDAAARGPGSIAAALWAVSKGASMLRVHDVKATVQAVRVWRGLAGLS
jgi:dihydropteroate synthase